ncbi:MAG TPA: hypothetical protein VMB84_13540 [Stellaceae bacterium]|nr:hypothetical protein [Stellaceae bacterium]
MQPTSRSDAEAQTQPALPNRDEPVDWPFEPFAEAALDGSIADRFELIAARHAERLAVCDAQSRSGERSAPPVIGGRSAAALGRFRRPAAARTAL